jgi:antitoxin component YwqK of YwqJK toxin-antitoxin module
MKFFLIITGCVLLFSCSSKKDALPTIASVNSIWLDSIRQSADTFYVKKYGTLKFAKAEYYLDRKNAIICQVMKDTSDTIRQIIITKNNKRNFFAEYYANGQLMAQLPLDSFGQYHGPSKYYYENGVVESEGNYEHGLKKGLWKNNDKEGKPTVTNEYDANGNVVKPVAN